ncbi:uncharacterized protein A4U43_C07F27160 [Asparagus officinalis]|uniref:Uncharacterized protein n=1 Tax=Asparagus officinalis TaxID=4686 RepID=A0A5P1EKG7_ASPOF|nr:uncharacterized protein A4U43_C07F27160 [Asparagus officinalis]
MQTPGAEALLGDHIGREQKTLWRSWKWLWPLTVPRLMRYNLTNKKDSIKVVTLKHDGGFHQEGLYGVNVKGLRLVFVHEDTPVSKVVVVLNVFGNEHAKTNAQYPDGDTRFPSWIRSTDAQWWTHLMNFTLVTFEERLRRSPLFCNKNLKIWH